MGITARIAKLFGKSPRGPSLLAADQARAAQAQANHPPETEHRKAEGLRQRMEAKRAAQRRALGKTADRGGGPE